MDAVINYLVGDATHPKAPGPKIIAHCCNDVGAWGAGFVMALSHRWPGPEAAFRALADAGRLVLGDCHLVAVEDDIMVANVIGQHATGWQNGSPPVRYVALAKGLRTLAQIAKKQGASVHMPRIGCGLAGGHWETVEGLILSTLCLDGVAVFVYDLPRS
jgi:O-acetyl-ADP-ribose deacetylase (regulator of RNase III)